VIIIVALLVGFYMFQNFFDIGDPTADEEVLEEAPFIPPMMRGPAAMLGSAMMGRPGVPPSPYQGGMPAPYQGGMPAPYQGYMPPSPYQGYMPPSPYQGYMPPSPYQGYMPPSPYQGGMPTPPTYQSAAAAPVSSGPASPPGSPVTEALKGGRARLGASKTLGEDGGLFGALRKVHSVLHSPLKPSRRRS
jgi:hypothetical protein